MVGDAPRAIGPLFHGLRLKQLSITAVVWRGGLGTLQQRIPPPVNLPSFQSLAQHLTQLHFFLFYPQYGEENEQYMVQPEHLVEYFRPLAQLQVLTLLCPNKLEGLTQLLQVLPQLHTLQLPDVTISGQQQLDTLLAATQITSLQLRQVEALDTSYADAPCSWQRLELTGTLDFKVVAYLPLHSLSQPLVCGISQTLWWQRHPTSLHKRARPCLELQALWPVASVMLLLLLLLLLPQQGKASLSSSGQQTVPAMSKRDMQHQAAVDGGASAADGYSPAGEEPPPATRLLDLPPALLDDVACWAMQLGARSLLPVTCRAFSQARLLHVPALRIQLGRQCCDQLLTPRVVAALQARTSKLTLTLWQPETEDSEGFRKQLAPTLQLPQTEYTKHYTDLLAHALAMGCSRDPTLTGRSPAPAMSQSEMQHQVAVDGGASATDGYSSAGEAPPPATRLLDLPPALQDDIACRVIQLGARSLLPLTCRAFSQARLLHAPALRIQLGRQCCDQLLTHRVVAALQARTSKLALNLWQPETEDSTRYRKQLAPTLQLPQTEYTQDYTELLAYALAKLDNCAAVEVCKLVSSGTYDLNSYRHLRCSPGLAQHLLDSFPSLTALTLEGLRVSNDELASLLSHPPLALQLQQLDVTKTEIPDGDEPLSVGPLFQGLQLKQLSIEAVRHKQPGTSLLPSFQPLAQHLTQLGFSLYYGNDDDDDDDVDGTNYLVQYLQPLAQLQVLTLPCQYQLDDLAELVQALPQLHTLQLPEATVSGQQQLDTLLAATQITSLQLASVRACDTSYADAPCSWQRLELQWIDWKAITYLVACLPLHSLTQPLLVGKQSFIVGDCINPEVVAALHHLAQACKVPVQIKEVELRIPHEVITPALLQSLNMEHLFGSTPTLQQQREDLAQLVLALQALQFCGKVKVYGLHEVTAADVLALAPLFRDCTHFELCDGSMEPSLEFWHQLVQRMPAVQQVELNNVEGSVSAAMHESLQLMAEQPWARWLHITICYDLEGSQLPACWQAGSWLMAGIIKVSLWAD
ncbi:hypothetical protein QJQ45_009001 [Haematococcus lacustris]|nr:hypothetical protein QJQ45_009001 [Haematococcus lacustris]